METRRRFVPAVPMRKGPFQAVKPESFMSGFFRRKQARAKGRIQSRLRAIPDLVEPDLAPTGRNRLRPNANRLWSRVGAVYD